MYSVPRVKIMGLSEDPTPKELQHLLENPLEGTKGYL
jgi:hypothetical protein